MVSPLPVSDVESPPELPERSKHGLKIHITRSKALVPSLAAPLPSPNTPSISQPSFSPVFQPTPAAAPIQPLNENSASDGSDSDIIIQSKKTKPTKRKTPGIKPQPAQSMLHPTRAQSDQEDDEVRSSSGEPAKENDDIIEVLIHVLHPAVRTGNTKRKVTAPKPTKYEGVHLAKDISWEQFLDVISHQVKTVSPCLVLSSMEWKPLKPKNAAGRIISSAKGLQSLLKAMESPFRPVIILEMAPPSAVVHQVMAVTAQNTPSASAHAAANQHPALVPPAPIDPDDTEVNVDEAGTYDEQLEDVMAQIEQRYPVGLCPDHPTKACFHHKPSGLHFELDRPKRAVWASWILKKQADLNTIPIASACFKRVHALKVGKSLDSGIPSNSALSSSTAAPAAPSTAESITPGFSALATAASSAWSLPTPAFAPHGFPTQSPFPQSSVTSHHTHNWPSTSGYHSSEAPPHFYSEQRYMPQSHHYPPPLSYHDYDPGYGRSPIASHQSRYAQQSGRFEHYDRREDDVMSSERHTHRGASHRTSPHSRHSPYSRHARHSMSPVANIRSSSPIPPSDASPDDFYRYGNVSEQEQERLGRLGFSIGCDLGAVTESQWSAVGFQVLTWQKVVKAYGKYQKHVKKQK